MTFKRHIFTKKRFFKNRLSVYEILRGINRWDLSPGQLSSELVENELFYDSKSRLKKLKGEFF